MVKIGNCPDSWGVLFVDDPKQMSWQRFLDEFQKAGYQYLELGPYGYLPADPEFLKEEFGRRGITVVSGSMVGHFENNLDHWRKELKRIAPIYKSLGIEYLVTVGLRYNDRATRNMTAPRELVGVDWKNYVKNLSELSKEAKEEYELKPVYHPHADTHVETEAQIERLLNETDPDVIRLCFDTGHHVIAGGEPISFMEKYGGRTDFLHVKNVNGQIKQPVIEKRVGNFESIAMGIYSDLDRGEIDFVEFKKVMDKWGYDGYAIIEQDVYPVNLDDSADYFNGPLMAQTRNLEYLEKIGFGTR